MSSLLRRLFSRAWRHAARAELAGEHEIAARAWMEAGERGRAARAHLRRATRIEGEARLAALRDAVEADADDPTTARAAATALADALVEKTGAALSASEDRRRLAEAAGLYEKAGDGTKAGALWERLGDDEAAAGAYERGGDVEAMERILARIGERQDRRHRYRIAFADFEARLAGGQRAHALEALRQASECADEDRAALIARLDELNARRPARGRVSVRVLPDGVRVDVLGGGVVRLGRDPEGELPLRAQGVSREHARLFYQGGKPPRAGDPHEPPQRGAWYVADSGSRNGTRLGGMALAAPVPLPPRGTIALGDALDVELTVDGATATLEITRGFDRGVKAWLVAPDARIDVAPALGLGARLEVGFVDGWPVVRAHGITLGGRALAEVDVELLRGDVLELAGVRLEVV